MDRKKYEDKLNSAYKYFDKHLSKPHFERLFREGYESNPGGKREMAKPEGKSREYGAKWEGYNYRASLKSKENRGADSSLNLHAPIWQDLPDEPPAAAAPASSSSSSAAASSSSSSAAAAAAGADEKEEADFKEARAPTFAFPGPTPRMKRKMEPSELPSEQRSQYGRFTMLLPAPSDDDDLYESHIGLPDRYSARPARPAADQMRELEEYMRGPQTLHGPVTRHQAHRLDELFDAANDLPMEPDDVFDEDIRLNIPDSVLNIPPPLFTRAQLNERGIGRLLQGPPPSPAEAQDDLAAMLQRRGEADLDAMRRGEGRYKPRLEENEFIMPFSDSSGYHQWGFGRKGRGYPYTTSKHNFGYGRHPFTPYGNMRGSF